MHVHLIRMRRQVISALSVVVGSRDYRLAAGLKIIDGVANPLQLAQPATRHRRQVQYDRLDAAVGFRIVESVDDILNQRLRLLLAQQFLQRPVVGIASQLINKVADRTNDQGCFRGHRRHLRRQRIDHDREYEQ